MEKHKFKLFHQTPLKILSFLSNRPGEIFCERDIKNATKTSAGAVNQTLRFLLDLEIISRKIKGNVFLYKLNFDSQILKYFKIFENILSVYDLVKEIKPYVYEVILYGSCANGNNTINSDIDLFIKIENKSRTKIKKIINKYRGIHENLKAVILDPLEIASSKKIDEVFYTEVNKGITLYKGRPDYERV